MCALLSRRNFLASTAALTAAASLGPTRFAHAAGRDTLKGVLIGAGGRGTGAAAAAWPEACPRAGRAAAYCASKRRPVMPRLSGPSR